MTQIVEWHGALWSVGEQAHGMFHCTVVNARNNVSGWNVGDHCWLEASEINQERNPS